MSTVRGIYRNGTVTLTATPDWPEECEVIIEPAQVPSIGMREEDWDDSPEGVAEWLRWYDSLEPLEMTPEEEAAWTAGLNAMGEYSAAHGHKGLDGLFPSGVTSWTQTRSPTS
ncbi:MAG: hypothetical protein U0746_21740 [Gemmataceae bacterium]